MKRSLILRLAAAAALVTALVGPALAQSNACARYRAELASLNRSGAAARASEAAAQKHLGEIGRLTAYHRQIGCEGGGFFFQSPECPSIAARIRALQASAGAVSEQAYDPAAGEARRRQLRAAIAKGCEESEPQPASTSGEAKGGDRLVCVRTCDGFFFPLEARPEGRADEGDLCKALCPGAEALLYRAPRDGNIEQAVSASGRPYMRLANALRYQKAYDPSCSCKKTGETWAQSLQKAERMIASRRSDIVVTQSIAERLSRVSLGAKPAQTNRRTPAQAALAARQSAEDVEVTGSIETADNGEAPAERPRARLIAPDRVHVPIARAP